MFTILLCASEEEAATAPSVDGVRAYSVSNLRAIEGARFIAAYATQAAREHVDYGDALSVVLSSIAKSGLGSFAGRVA